MKDIITNFGEAMELVKQISEFDPISMETLICMIIDTESSKYKEPAVDIVERMWDAVQAVNEILGPYQPDKKEKEHDHKN